MKKSVLNLGEILKKSQQKEIMGGYGDCHIQLGEMCRNPYTGGFYGCCAVGSCQFQYYFHGGAFEVWQCEA